MRCSPGSADAVQQNEMQSRKSGVHRQWSTARMVDRPDNRTVYVYRPGAPVQTLVERNSEIDTTVGAVCDRAQSLSFGKMRGHRPRLQKLWYQIHCYAPLGGRLTRRRATTTARSPRTVLRAIRPY